MEVGAFAGVLRTSRSANPIHRIAARIGRFDHRLGLVALAQAGHLEAAQRLIRHIRHVHIQQHGLVNTMLAETQHQLSRDTGCRIEMIIFAGHQRNSD